MNDIRYIEIQKKALFDMFEFLFSRKEKFFVSLRFDDLEFEPTLSDSFIEKAKTTNFFILPIFNENHIHIDKENIYIYLNLTENNNEDGFEYKIKVPIFSIFHILSSNREVVFANQLFFNEDLPNQKKSIDLFLNNPENKDFN